MILGSILPLNNVYSMANRFRVPQYGVRPMNTRVPVSGKRVSTRTRNGQRRDLRRFNKTSHLEINRAEGGYKNLNQGGSLKIQSVDIFRKMFLDDQGRYQLDDSVLVDNLDLTVALRNSSEFLTATLLCYKYKVTGVRLSFDYSLVPPAGTTMTKLILNMETDLVAVDDPKINKNAMQLSMSRQGVKNFWFNINKGNTKEDNLDWIPSTEDPNMTLKLHISSQGDNVNPSGDLLYLGLMKISFIINLMMADINNLSNRISQRGFRLVKVHNLEAPKDEKQDLQFDANSIDIKRETISSLPSINNESHS
jgi:hypothetical protein